MKIAIKVCLLGLVVALIGCGTIVGNPKKPQGDGKPTSAIVYEMPDLGILIPDDAVNEASLNLVGVGDRADKVAVTSFSRRLKRMLRQIERVKESVNAISRSQRLEGDQESVLKFNKKGRGGELGGIIKPLDDGGEFKFQAKLCHLGQLFAEVLWDEAGSKISLTRDFSHKADGGDDSMGLVSQIVVTKVGDALSYDLKVAGAWTGEREGDGEEGPYITERAFAKQWNDGSTSLKLVRDITTEAPSQGHVFVGDEYVVANFKPMVGDARRKFDINYFGFSPRLSSTCLASFNEEASSLFTEYPLDGGFCFGPRKSDTNFLARLAELSGFGVAKARDLTGVTLTEREKGCD